MKIYKQTFCIFFVSLLTHQIYHSPAIAAASVIILWLRRMSTLDILVEKDGEPVEVGNEIQLRVQVTMSNEQGSGSIEIPVSIMDIPSPPKAAWVDEVFKESVTVYWKEPTDDGGCEIKHYVVECLDVTMGNLWVSLAMTDSGEPRSIQARNLIEGHRYMFRVAAANKVGQSEPCEVRGITLVRDPWDCPGECGRCTVIDWMPTFADLTWTQPFTDGGAPIISYIIQLKEKSMREWIDSIEIPVEELEIDGNVIKGRCENLVEEYEYMFRVLAVNKGGRGHPGPPSQSVIAMYKNIPPSIKEGNIRDLKIKEGRSIRFDVWIAGEPAPTIEWLRNDEKIVPDEKTSINVYSKNASVYTLKNVVLSIPKALEEDHSGVYKLRLKNESGVFESMADINIEPPPGKQKKSKPKEEKKTEKEEKDEEKDQQQVQPEILRKLSTEGKEEDKDSGLKIGEESLPDSEESVWTEYTESSEEQELDLTGTAVTTPVANDSLTDEQKENAYNSKHHSNSTLKSKSDKEIIAEVSDDEGVQGVEQSDDHSSDGEFLMDTNIIETNNQEVQSSYKTPQNTSDSQSYNEHFDINNDVSNNTDHEQYKICNNIVSNKNMDDHENSFNNDNTQNTEGEENTDYYENNDLSHNATFNYNSFNNCESYQSNDLTENESNDNDYSSNIYNSYNNALHNNESSEIDNTENKTATDHDNTKMKYCNGDYKSKGISNQSSYSDSNSDNYEENSDYITARNNSNENSNVDNNNYCFNNNKLDDSNQDNTDTERFNGTSNGFSTSYTGGSCYGGSSMESNTEVDSKEPEQSEEEKRNIIERQKREEKRKLEEKAKEDRRLAKEKQRQEELDRLEALVREEERLKREVALERERKRQEELAEQARIKEEKEKEEQRKKEAKIKNEAELKLQQENLNKRLEHLGFIKSSKAAVFDYTNGDGVLISLLDQMNRDDQNFKVWDREDYSFLRWYMTRQMEAYIMKEKELPFVNLIEGDKLEYIERITEDYVHLDEIFLNAAASVFNKDIIIIPSDEKEEVRVLYGGAGTTKGKGSPLYLGCVGPIGETIPVQYYSIMQDQNSKVKFVYSDSTIDRRISVIANGELIPSSPKIKLKDDRKRSWKRMDSYTGGNSKDLDNMINSIMLEENMDELFDRLDSCEDDLEEDENVESINSLDAICDNFTEGDNNKSEWHESVPYATHVSENNEEDQNTLEKENEIQECLTTSESYSPFENSCENNNTETVNNEEWSCESDSSSSIHDENIKVQEDEEVPAHQNQWQNYYGNYYYNQPNTEEDTETLETESVNDTETTEVMDATHESASQVSNDDSGWYSNAADYQYNSYGWYNNEQTDENVKDDAQEEGNTNTEDSREATPVNEIDYSNESNNDEKWNSDEVNENLNDADSESCDYNDRIVINHDSEMYYTDTQNRLTPSIEITNEYIGNSDESTPEPSEVANDSSEEVLPAELSNDIKTPTLTEDTSKFEKENSFLSTDFVNKQNEPSNIPTSLSALDNLDFSSPFGSTNQDEAPQPGVKLRQRRYSRRKSTTSFRWSGSEFEMDNPDSANQDADSTSNSNDQSKICNSTDQLKANFTENIAKFGLKETVPEPSKCKDTCLVSLMSQMMLAGEDFKVWDKDDHSFLSWYIVKQMDAQISTGKAATFLNLEKKHSEDIESAFRSGSPTKSQYFIRAFARVFNRDVIVVDSNGAVDYLHGGVNSKHGKGQPLIIGMIKDISNGSEDVVYSSLEPNFDAERDSIVETLSHQCKA